MKGVDQYLIPIGASIRAGLERLNATGGDLLLAVDSAGRLVRTVSDGDIRRALLEQHDLHDPLSSLRSKKPWSVTAADPLETAHQLMTTNGVDFIPLLDEAGRPVRLLSRNDFEETVWLSSPHMGNEERRYVDEAFESNWIAPLGPNVDAFEAEIAALTGVKAAAAVASGTAALHLALILEGVGQGDRVFCSDLTFVASVNPILYQGATPVLIDAEPDSWNMSPTALANALRAADKSGRLPKAIVVVNVYGHQADMDALEPVAAEYDVPIIEDAAESIGASYRGRKSGSFGKSAVFSFNGNKIITTSGGGMLVSNDEELIERARFLSTQAKEPLPYYFHEVVGYNYRMSNVLAGIGRGQLSVLDDRVVARRAVFERYRSALSGLPGARWMEEPEHARGTHWLSAMLISPDATDVTPDTLIAALNEIGIDARHVWRPMHMQPLLKSCDLFPHSETTPYSRQHYEQGVCLPSGSNMTEGQQERVIAAIRAHFEAVAAA